MTERIALRCPHCQMVSYRPVGFVRAKVHFVCNYCHEIAKINHRQLQRALSRGRQEQGTDVLEHTRDERG
jgi:Fe2+ or Zn2+ uptake regulation protein